MTSECRVSSQLPVWLTLGGRYDEHDGPRNPASAFVPREAAMAARQAAIDREKALAAATPLPATNDADIERPPAPALQPSRRYVPKLPLPRFTRGRRPVSQPGKSRSGDEKAASGASIPTTPAIGSDVVDADTVENAAAAEKLIAGGGEVKLDGNTIPRVTTPTELDESEYLENRSKSDRGARRDLAASQSAPAPVVGLSGLDPATAVPARLLPGGGAATPMAAPPSNANLLTEALLLERGRRRLAAQQGTAPSLVRLPSVGAARSAIPSRQPTPPTGAMTANASVGVVGGGGASAGAGGPGVGTGISATVPAPAPPHPDSMTSSSAPSRPVGAGPSILSPMPMFVSGVKKGTKFKSVPTPIGTPRVGMQEEVDPMESVKPVNEEQRDQGTE